MADLLRGVLDAIDVGVIAVDADGRPLVVNACARALIGGDVDARLAAAAGDPVARLTAALAGLELRTSVRPLADGGAVAVVQARLASESFLDSIVENIPNMIFVKE